jgi:hypothetical protein
MADSALAVRPLHIFGEFNLPTKRYESGDPAPASGIYQEIGPRGGKRKEVTLPKGHKFPPTESAGGSYALVRRSHNKSGRS